MNRILLVEDDPALARGLADNLRYESYEVITASDGEAAYALIHDAPPDLIILDVMLPRLTGYDLCRRVRSEGLQTPILMLTACGDEADRVRGLDLGADDYVTKPFSTPELLARVRVTMRHERERMAERLRHERELRVAADVQQRLFPQALPPLATLDYAGICRPARGVGGDAYDFIAIAPGRLGLLAADVSGKGMSAALLMASLHGCLRAHAPALGDRPEELLARANRLLYETSGAERFVTLVYGVYDDAARTFTYINAGHPPPLVIRTDGRLTPSAATVATTDVAQVPPTADVAQAFPPSLAPTSGDGGRPASGDVRRLEPMMPPVGMFEDATAAPQQVALGPGDWLVMFSDGIVEATDERGEEFGDERIVEIVRQHHSTPASDVRDAILGAVRCHAGAGGQADDLTVIVARVRETGMEQNGPDE